jgi:hypothetical protein
VGVVEPSQVVQLARPRSGHFDLGTGYHGDLWLDLDALLLRPAVLRPYIGWLGERLREHAVNAGTAVAACLTEIRGRGAIPVAVAALLSLGPASTTVPASLRVPFYAAGTIPSQAWPAGPCPLCAAGTPFTDPSSGA